MYSTIEEYKRIDTDNKMISNTFRGVLSEVKHLFKYARVHLVVVAVVFELQSQG